MCEAFFGVRKSRGGVEKKLGGRVGHFDISASHFVTVTNMTIFWSIFSAKNLVPQGYTIFWDYQYFENTAWYSAHGAHSSLTGCRAEPILIVKFDFL